MVTFLPSIQMRCIVALTLLCLLRIGERIESLVIAPRMVQIDTLGRVIAHPWELKSVEISGGGTGDFVFVWTYSSRPVPTFAHDCQAIRPDPKWHVADRRGCWITKDNQDEGIASDRERFTLQLWSPAQVGRP